MRIKSEEGTSVWSVLIRNLVIASMGVLLVAPCARAQDRLGGHFGVVFPLITRVDGGTTNIGDDFKIGFPTGITVRTSDHYAFDLEFVPTIDPQQNRPTDVSLTIHPGVLRALGNSWTGGVRMAFDLGSASWGFTPLLNKRLHQMDHGAYFIELVVPVRFQDEGVGGTQASITLGVHVGMGF